VNNKCALKKQSYDFRYDSLDRQNKNDIILRLLDEIRFCFVCRRPGRLYTNVYSFLFSNRDEILIDPGNHDERMMQRLYDVREHDTTCLENKITLV